MPINANESACGGGTRRNIRFRRAMQTKANRSQSMQTGANRAAQC
jgi:hypothetical protein